MNISFGKKIQIATSNVFDNEQKQYIPVTCYKFDCLDRSDFQEIEQLDDSWRYTGETVCYMKQKFHKIQRGQSSDIVVFTLEKNNGEKIGLCCAEDKERGIEINYIETKQDGRHKYAGQALLASIGTLLIDNSRQWSFIIKNAVSNAHDFYEKICGFRESEYSDLEMNRSETRNFIKQTEQRTKSTIIE